MKEEQRLHDYIDVSPIFVKSVNLSRAVLSNLFQIHSYEFVSCLGLAVTLISSTCTYEDGRYIERYKSLLITMLTNESCQG